MKQGLSAALAIAGKDLRTEWRTKESLNASVSFALVILVLFSFAFDLDREEKLAISGGLLWLVYAFAGALLGGIDNPLGAVLGGFAVGVIENLFASDLAFLQDLYRRVNAEGHTRAAATCPACRHEFTVDLAGGRVGES